MPQQCSVPGCKSGYTETVQSFPYPKDEKRKKLWLKQIGLKEVGKNAVVCIEHFLDNYIIPFKTVNGKPGKLKLCEKAVPTQFNFGPKKRKRKRTSEAKEVPEKITKFDNHYVDHMVHHNAYPYFRK